MTAKIELPPKIDHAAIVHLMEQLKSHDGTPVRVNAAESKGIGGLASQVILAAKRKWQNEDTSFEFSTSEAVEADLMRLGLLDEFKPKEQGE